VVEGLRWALLGTDYTVGLMSLVSAGMALLLFLSGLFCCKRMEERFADVI